MKLDQYLKTHNITAESFAKLVGQSVYAVGKWRRGERVPRWPIISLIQKITKGEVKADDHLKAKADFDKRQRAA